MLIQRQETFDSAEFLRFYWTARKFLSFQWDIDANRTPMTSLTSIRQSLKRGQKEKNVTGFCYRSAFSVSLFSHIICCGCSRPLLNAPAFSMPDRRGRYAVSSQHAWPNHRCFRCFWCPGNICSILAAHLAQNSAWILREIAGHNR